MHRYIKKRLDAAQACDSVQEDYKDEFQFNQQKTQQEKKFFNYFFVDIMEQQTTHGLALNSFP